MHRFTLRGFCVSGVVSLCAVDLRAGDPDLSFTDEAVARGINYTVSQVAGAGRGVAFVDLDNDGDADFVAIGRTDGRVGVWENDGTGHFIDRSNSTGLPLITSGSGVTAADYDSDGDLDLYFANWTVPNILARNDGGFTFTNVTSTAGVADIGAGTGCAWGDIEGDGRLDLYVANITHALYTTPNRCYSNINGISFANLGFPTGELNNEMTWQAVYFDYDLDGDPDLYLSQDKGEGTSCLRHNFLYRNDNGSFVDVTDTSGTAACMDSMGVGMGDFDNNRWPDLYLTNFPPGNRLFLNNGDGTFTNATTAAGVNSFAIGWGALMFDYDLDTYIDLYVCNEGALNRLYTHGGTWPCVDMAVALGVDSDDGVADDSFCIAAADIDNDGDADFVVEDRLQPLRLYINHHDQLGRQWVKFRTVGEGLNGFAIGATVQIRTGAQWQLQQVHAGANFKSQNELTLLFGLDQATVVDQVEVLWPGGNARSLANYPAGATWSLYPEVRLGDADDDGDIDGTDFAVFDGCIGASPPTALVPGCEIMDFDGNAVIDCSDWGEFTARWTAGSPPDLPACLAPGNPVDFDGDGDVDLGDFAQFALCFGGANLPPAASCPPGIDADFDDDGDVDLGDFAAFALAYTGAQ